MAAPKKTRMVATTAELPEHEWTGVTSEQAIMKGSTTKGGPPVPTNAPFGGSASAAPATPTTSASTPAPRGPTSLTRKPAYTQPSQPAERVEPAPGDAPAPRGGSGGSIGLIWGLGVGLIVANLLAGDNSASLIRNVFYPPDKQRATPPQNSFFPIIGEIIFLVILATLARFSDTSRQLVLTFLIGLWLLWLMFKFPAVYKAGIAGTVGQLFSQGTVSSSGMSGSSTSQPASQPASGRRGGSPVGIVPHHSYIMG